MGAEYNEFKVTENLSSTDVVAIADGLIEEAQYNYGNSGYSGSFAEATGAQIISNVFEDYGAAQAWLEDNAQKWGPILIAKTKNGGWAMGAWCSS